jgi:hypothetical protein
MPTKNPQSAVSTFGLVVGVAVLVGAIVGTTPSILVICVSPAKSAPWRSLPFLVAGATLGFIIIGLPWSLFQTTENMPWLTLGMPMIGAMAGGAVATRFLPGARAGQRVWFAALFSGFVLGLLAGAIGLVLCLMQLFGSGSIAMPSSVPLSVGIAGFVVYLIAVSIAFAALVRRIVWTRRAFWKSIAAGLLAAVLLVTGIVLLVFSTSR